MSQASFRLESIISVTKQANGLYLVATSNGKKRLVNLPFVVTELDHEDKIFTYSHNSDDDVDLLIEQVRELLSAKR